MGRSKPLAHLNRDQRCPEHFQRKRPKAFHSQVEMPGKYPVGQSRPRPMRSRAIQPGNDSWAFEPLPTQHGDDHRGGNGGEADRVEGGTWTSPWRESPLGSIIVFQSLTHCRVSKSKLCLNGADTITGASVKVAITFCSIEFGSASLCKSVTLTWLPSQRHEVTNHAYIGENVRSGVDNRRAERWGRRPCEKPKKSLARSCYAA